MAVATDDPGKGFGLRISRAATGNEKISAGFTLEDLAVFLSAQLKQPVIDATGLTGRYIVEMEGPLIYGTNNVSPLFEKSGFRLEPQATLLEVLVVSEIEHPALDD